MKNKLQRMKTKGQFDHHSNEDGEEKQPDLRQEVHAGRQRQHPSLTIGRPQLEKRSNLFFRKILLLSQVFQIN